MSEPFTAEQLAQIRTVYDEALEAYESEFKQIVKQAVVQMLGRSARWSTTQRNRVLVLGQFLAGGPALTTTQKAEAAQALLSLLEEY